MKNNLIILIIILSSPLVLSAQKKQVLNYNKVSGYIFKNYHPDSSALAKYCGIGCVFVKFKVSAQGKIINLSFSGDTDSTKFITDELVSAVNSITQDRELIAFLKISKRE
ncbi:hypothetical protein [Mucilaginibacter phyllosphaerae]|uniref:TonB C-terminal domain-containing protein n=1 Tax=Mucilaginibacter phyllosphaerae TaxID=1812349 RepID=A0A4Y8AMH0_9SPHI|nr:hypothetical protein [Mucilaginibacter phyllosphaerae]MBB3967453.1 hypothetical protein [Mucilaginibacter phyllosphaerae]TEW69479.1 hypothetical protein E2R65_04730 [Mucilaginibacter phyllosphaerae]GGH20786.1 hypothetical protein GCM10007352_33050 [Mucilaginibacter phyllosphaerae]